MATRTTTKATLAAEAWRRIFDFIIATSDHRNAVLARLGLTPNDSRALSSLDADTGPTMRALAREWRCDASTATWIVDRLEAKGLAERRAHPADRRVKLVVLTPHGVQAKAEMIAGTYTPPRELLDLDRSELLLLRDATAPLRDLVAPATYKGLSVVGASTRRSATADAFEEADPRPSPQDRAGVDASRDRGQGQR